MFFRLVSISIFIFIYTINSSSSSCPTCCQQDKVLFDSYFEGSFCKKNVAKLQYSPSQQDNNHKQFNAIKEKKKSRIRKQDILDKKKNQQVKFNKLKNVKKRQHTPVQLEDDQSFIEGIHLTMRLGYLHNINSEINNFNYISKGDKDTATIGISFGKHIGDHFGIELEYVRDLKHKFKFGGIDKVFNTEVSSNSVFANIYAYITPARYFIRPYIKLGSGISINTMEDTFGVNSRPAFLKNRESKFAWNVAYGLSIKYSNLDFLNEIRYLSNGSIRSKVIPGALITTPTEMNLRNLSFLMGLRLNF